MLKRLYGVGARPVVGLLLAAAVGYYIVAVLAGAPVVAPLLVWLCAGVYIVLPGLLLARLAGEKAFPRSMLWPVALLLGTVFLFVCYVLAVRFWRPLINLLPLPLAAVSAWREGRALLARHRVKGTAAMDTIGSGLHEARQERRLLALMYAGVLAAYAFAGPAANALPSVVGPTVLHQDLLFNVGNAEALSLGFPPWDIRFLGIRLRYHLFTELVAAMLSMVSGQSCYTVAVYGQQPLMLAAAFVCLRGMGHAVFAGSRRKSLLYVAGLFTAASCVLVWPLFSAAHPFGNSFITHLLTNINAQTTATVLFAVFFGLFTDAARRRFATGWVQAALCVLDFLALCMAKGPVAGILVCAVAVGLCAGLLGGKQARASIGWRGLALGVTLVAVFGAVYLLLFSGNAESAMWMELDGTLNHGVLGGAAAALPAFAAPVLWLVQAVCMLPAPVVLGVAGFATGLKGFFKQPVWRLACWFGAGGGMLAFFLFNQQSFSQVYFFFTAVLLLVVLMVDDTEKWAPCLMSWMPPEPDGPVARAIVAGRYPRGLRVLAGVLVGVSLFTAGCTYAGYVARGVGNLAHGTAGAPQAVVTESDEAAAAWLRANTPRDAVFATNRISAGEGFVGVSNLYSALSGRRAHMEGFRYMEAMGIGWELLQDHVEANAALFDAATPPEEVARMAAERGISYLVWHAFSEGDNSQLAAFEVVFAQGDDPTTIIYKLP